MTDKTQNITEEGVNAFLAWQDSDFKNTMPACPYKEGTPECDDWEWGWWAACEFGWDDSSDYDDWEEE